MPFRSQSLCQTIRYHVLRWTIFQPSCSIFNTIPDKVILDIDMFGTSVMFRIMCKCDGALVVAVDDVLVADVVTDFFEEAQKPDLFLERVK